jgi:hypothetical protein
MQVTARKFAKRIILAMGIDAMHNEIRMAIQTVD